MEYQLADIPPDRPVRDARSDCQALHCWLPGGNGPGSRLRTGLEGDSPGPSASAAPYVLSVYLCARARVTRSVHCVG